MKHLRGIMKMLMLFAMAQIAAGCGRSDTPDAAPEYGSPTTTQSAVQVYRFGISPMRNADRISLIYQPVIDSINSASDGRWMPPMQLQLCRDYVDLSDKLKNNELTLALVNAATAIRSEQWGYHIVGKVSGDAAFHGIILVRKNSPIHQVSDLRGRKISFPAPQAMAGTMLNIMFLHDHGIDVGADATAVYCGSQDSSVLNLYEGITDAAGSWPQAWESIKRDRPGLADALEVRWQSDPLIHLAIIAGGNVPREHVDHVLGILFRLQDTEAGRKILADCNVPSFEPATSRTYDPARKFLIRYEQTFGGAVSE